MRSTKFIALGTLITATTIATAFANADKMMTTTNTEVSTLSGETKEEHRYRDMGKSEHMRSYTGEIRSQSGMIKRDEVKPGYDKRREEKSEKKEERKAQSEAIKAKMTLRDTIIDKLLAGEVLTDTEKAEAKKMLEERKARREAVKSNIKEAREEKGEKLTAPERREIRQETRKELREEKK